MAIFVSRGKKIPIPVSALPKADVVQCLDSGSEVMLGQPGAGLARRAQMRSTVPYCHSVPSQSCHSGFPLAHGLSAPQARDSRRPARGGQAYRVAQILLPLWKWSTEHCSLQVRGLHESLARMPDVQSTLAHLKEKWTAHTARPVGKNGSGREHGGGSLVARMHH